MHEVVTLEYVSFPCGYGKAFSSEWQVMNLIGNRRRPKCTERFICAKAGSPTRRETQGDGTPIVPEEEDTDSSLHREGAAHESGPERIG